MEPSVGVHYLFVAVNAAGNKGKIVSDVFPDRALLGPRGLHD
jgi:hypothetical protein